ncbi:MAG TPA: L-histidine N(alpha)-methyltransferase [Pyrinomonadaceae bacterium]|nr:L-histidine N(alpha)-methyltransferase [Pyrinomonadaceae bacterium]
MSQGSSVHPSDDRLIIHDLASTKALTSFAEDVRAGLLSGPRRLFPKYFYDELGSQLFEAICLLPEYYLTRAEDEIIERYAGEIVAEVPGRKRLVEMGSGSASKTRRIIEAILKEQQELLYIPVDISATALETSSRVLLQGYPRLSINALAGDYYGGLKALGSTRSQENARTLALFLGSNIGNFDREEARDFLRALRRVLRDGDSLLLGADLKKERDVLEAAYDDSLGVTAAFNLNLLARINRELGADFDLRAFRHFVRYDEEAGRVEIYAKSLRAQVVRIESLGLELRFEEGELIHTENSYKYDMEDLSRLAAETGFAVSRTWLDSMKRFSSNLFVASPA